MLDSPTKDLAYQRMTRLGPSVVEYLTWKRMSGAAEATLDSYERELSRLCVRYPASSTTEIDSGMLLAHLMERPEGSRPKISAIYKDFWKWATAWKRLPHNPMALLPTIRQEPQKILDVFTAEEQALLYTAARNLPWPKRDSVIMRVLFETGARLGDIRMLRWEDVNEADGFLLFKHRKGGKTLVVSIGDELRAALIDARHEPYPKNFRNTKNGRGTLPQLDHFILYPSGFAGNHGAGPIVSWVDPFVPMAKSTIQRWWTRLTREAGIKHRKLHMTRHTVGTELYQATRDIVQVQQVLGHESMETSRKYVHQDPTKLRPAVDALRAWREARGS